MRDCVMHWDDKARADSPAFLYVVDREILVLGAVGPQRGGETTFAGMSWSRFESSADRLRRWAAYVLDERLAASDPDHGPA